MEARYVNGAEHLAGPDAAKEKLGDESVVIAGGGPVGLILATVLAKYGVRSIILERNDSTTRLVFSYFSEDVLTTAQMAKNGSD